MRWAVAVALAATLSGCGQKAQEAPAKQAAQDEPPAATNVEGYASVNAGAEAAAESNGLGTLPPADAALRFVGVWATSAANCASSPWTFTEKAVSAADGPNCSFYEVRKVPGGYDLAAQCPDKQPVHTDLIKLRFAESARAMLVESNAIKPTGLIYCRE
jgi:hypothetical protein